MGRTKVDRSLNTKKSSPALTLEAREQQMIGLAVDAAEKQLRDGTASAQVIVHYLKLGSTTQKYEMEKLKNENDLLKAKVEALKAERDTENRYIEAINAMRLYSGKGDSEDEY